jgi:hypothetical protein
MSMLTQLKSTDVSPRAAFISVLGLLVVSTGVILWVVRGASGVSGQGVERSPRRPATPAQAIAARAQASAPAPEVSSYAVIVSRNLFQAPPGSVPPATTPQNSAPPPVFPPAGDAPQVEPFSPTLQPAEPPPRPKVACTGIVEIAGQPYALLEQLELATAKYVQVGESAFDCTLTAISARGVTLEANGEVFTLAVGANKVEPEPAKPDPQQGEGGTGKPPEGPPAEGAAPNGAGQNGAAPRPPTNGEGAPGRSSRRRVREG